MPSDKNHSNKKYDEDSEEYETSDVSSSENEYASDSEQKMDRKVYQQFLNQLFPSKYAKEKAEYYEDESDSDDDDDRTPSKKKKNKKLKKNKNKDKSKDKGKDKANAKDKDKAKSKDKTKSKSKSKAKDKAKDRSNEKHKKSSGAKKKSSKKNSDTDSDDSEYDSEYYSDYESDQAYEDGEQQEYNIILSVGGKKLGDIYMDDYDEEYDEEWIEEDDEELWEEEDDDDELSEQEEYDEESDEEDVSTSKSKKNGRSKSKVSDEDMIHKFTSIINELSPDERNNELVQKCKMMLKGENKNLREKEKKKTKKERAKNTETYRKLQRDNNASNDMNYFQENLTPKEQKAVIKQLKEIRKHSHVAKPYRLSLLETDIPPAYKAFALKKLNSLRYLEPGEGEYYKVKNWVDAFMQIPFGKYKELPLTIEDGIEKCNDFMEKAKKRLDEAVFGLNDAKMQVLQMVGQWIANPKSVGTAIAIKGPMGTGKTTLVKEGISKVLGRDFAFIALGGATDSSFLEGHSYTYEGSTWGKIVQILIQCKSMNPVIYFDELDKISNTPKGEEIVGILTHLTDTSQNNCFHDKFFSEIDFDLSRCLFIFSYNNEEAISPILRDRMYKIQTKGYSLEEKTTIVNNYQLPLIYKQVNFQTEDITIPDETIEHIVNNYTKNGEAIEEGVRNLKRCLEIIFTKLNLYRLIKPETNLFEEDVSFDVKFPITITSDVVDKLIVKNENEDNSVWKNWYM